MDTCESYEIRIEGHLSASWADWFEGLTIRHTESGETVLAELFGTRSGAGEA